MKNETYDRFSDPQNGRELDTSFAFSASLWTDEQLPLKFEFGFVVATSASSGEELEARDEYVPYSLVQSVSVKAFGQSQLPAGLAAANDIIVMCVQVFDNLNANASKHAAVTVEAAFIPNDALLGLVQDQLSGGSFDLIKQTISIVRYDSGCIMLT